MSNHVKSYCVACGAYLDKRNADRYRQFGNYCLKCCAKASTKALKRRAREGFTDGVRAALKESAKVL